MTDRLTGSGLLQLMCDACVNLLDADGAGISLMTPAGSGGVLGASGTLAHQVEEWQFSLGEGPCKQAFAGGRPIMVSDVAADTLGHTGNWPVFAEVVRQAGIKAIFAFPLQVNGVSLGALDIFRSRPGFLSAEQVGVASALADLASPLLMDEVERIAADSSGDDSVYRFAVHQAAGMVAAQLNISAPEALVRIRARAFAEGRTVTELAVEVVARRLRFVEEDI